MAFKIRIISQFLKKTSELTNKNYKKPRDALVSQLNLDKSTKNDIKSLIFYNTNLKKAEFLYVL